MYDDAEALRRSLVEPRLFEVVFDRHFVAIHRYVRHCLDVHAADDLAAETFVRAFAARRRYVAQTRDARAWLFAIATNLVRDELRRRARANGLGRRLAFERSPTPASGEARDPELEAALRAIPEAEREVLVLLAWAELSYEEIAAVTGTPVGTVRSRLNRARARLRQSLAPESIPSGECNERA